MRMFLGIIVAVILLQASASLSSAQDAGNPPVPFEQTVRDYKTKIDDCLTGLSKKDASREERGAAVFSTSYCLESYEQFVKGIDEKYRQKINADSELTGKLCSLHIAYAEYQLEDAKTEANPPAVTALENAFKEYQLACALLPGLADRDTIVRNGTRIETGLAKTIAGLNKYAGWFEKDVFMNPAGKKWQANPAPQAEKLRAQIAGKTSSSGELAICEKALEQTMKDIQAAAERKDGATALENMTLGARWLTTILQKSPEAFLKNFRKYNDVTRLAMEEARKGYSQEKMQEFSRFYEPLKSNYLFLTAGKK